MKIYNKNTIVNKLIAKSQTMIIGLDENTGANEIEELLGGEHNGMDEFFGVLNASYIISDEQRRFLVGNIVAMHNNDSSFLVDILRSPNAKNYTSSIMQD
jgi:hypothetical protein